MLPPYITLSFKVDYPIQCTSEGEDSSLCVWDTHQ